MSSPYAGFHDLEDTHTRGQASEAILKAAFLARGIPVLVPEYDNEPYDFVPEHAGQFLRIQAKTAYQIHEGTCRFETVTTRSRSDGYERSGYDGKIDCFAVFNPELGEVYLISEGEASSGKMEIRYEPTENNQQVGVNWHEDYLIDEVLSCLVSEPSSP